MTNAVRTTPATRVPMDSMRKSALAVGVLFILTFITSIGAVFAYGPVLSAGYVTGAGADGGVYLGAFLELMLILTNIGCAVVLFPILRRQNEALALSYVAARIMECTFILVGLLSLLTIVTLRQTGAGADPGTLTTIGSSLLATHNWTFLLGPGFADGVGTGMILGYLMFKSGLVGRRMALVGLVGGTLLATSGVGVLLGIIPQGGAVQGIMTIPEIIWEAFLGLYLVAKGFQRTAPIMVAAASAAGLAATLPSRTIVAPQAGAA